MKKPSTPVATFWFAVLVCIWGTTWAAIRVGLEGIPPFTGAFLRFALAASVLLLLAPRLGADLSGDWRTWRVWILSGLLTFTISYGVVYWAEQWVPSGLASILFATFPLLTALGALVLLPGEKLRRPMLAGIALGLIGIIVIFSEDLSKLGSENVLFASIVFMLSPISSALGSVLVKRWGAGIHPVAMTAVPMAIGGALLGCVALVGGTRRGLAFHTGDGGKHRLSRVRGNGAGIHRLLLAAVALLRDEALSDHLRNAGGGGGSGNARDGRAHDAPGIGGRGHRDRGGGAGPEVGRSIDFSP